MRIDVKICGLTATEEAEAVAGLHPDYIGLVFAEKSRRRVGLLTAKRIVEIAHRENIGVAGVFAEQYTDEIESTAKYFKLDAVQLHGERYAESVLRLPADIKVWRVCKSKYTGRFAPADRFVLDGAGYGGDGVLVSPAEFDGVFGGRFEGSLNKSLPVILAGGLDADNVADAVKNFRDSGYNIVGVDVSSGVEFPAGAGKRTKSAPGGGKDIELVERFISAVRGINE